MPAANGLATLTHRDGGEPRLAARLGAAAWRRRIRVMHAVESFCGGVFSSVGQIVNHLDPSRFEVTLVHSLRPETPADFARRFAPHVRLVYLPMRREIHPGADLRAFFALRRLVLQERPDVLHLHSSKAGMLGRAVARSAREMAVFYSPRGWSFLRQDVPPARRFLFRSLERLGAGLGGTVVACSEGEYQAGRPLVRALRLIPNAVDLAELDGIVAAAPAPALPSAAPLTIAICARLTAARAPTMFAEVAQLVRARCGAQVRFVWIGAGDSPEVLTGAGVEVTGWLPRPEAVRRLLQADIYLHTSLWEGMPLAILEAMALAKPVVATDVVGNRDLLLHGQTGFLESNVSGLTAALLQLLGDSGLRSRMGQLGRRRVEAEFSLPAMIAAWQGLYCAAVAPSSGPAAAARSASV